MSIKVTLMSYGFTLNEIGGYVGIHYASADNVSEMGSNLYFHLPKC
jgi:hypothetical protein